LKTLIVAPEICSPWTEGRKNFVRDLVDWLWSHEQLFVLTSRPAHEYSSFPCEHRILCCRWKPQHLLSILRNLSSIIKDNHPEIVCHFPYGTFRRYYGLANKSYMASVDRICSRNGVPCLTIMYSIDASVSPGQLDRLVSHLVLGERDNWHGDVIDPGLRFDHWPALNLKSTGPPTVLFMAGMHQQNKNRVDHVLKVRGLDLLLKTGAILAKDGVRLIIASPLFENLTFRKYVLNSKSNSWPENAVKFESVVTVPEIFSHVDLFVFPYSKQIQHFIPTSVRESMSASVPVVIPDFALFKALIKDGETGFVFKSGNHRSLAEKIQQALTDRQRLRQIGEASRQYARTRWSIERSAQQLRILAQRVIRATEL